MITPCPRCEDGSVWDREGSTGRPCPACKGTAEVGHLDATEGTPADAGGEIVENGYDGAA